MFYGCLCKKKPNSEREMNIIKKKKETKTIPYRNQRVHCDFDAKVGIRGLT